MQIFLAVLVLLGLGLELYSLFDKLKHIRFDYKTDKAEAEPGEPIQVTSQVVNTGIVPVSYVRASVAYPTHACLPEGCSAKQKQFHQTVDTVFRLWGRQRVRRTITVTFAKRGVHFFRGAVLHRGDFFALRESTEQFDQRRQVLIYPPRIDNDSLYSAIGTYCGDMIAQRHLLRDPILTMGVREYSGREPMKTISWSQSARRDKLMVREFDFTRDMTCCVLLATDGITPVQEGRMDLCCGIVRTVCETLTQNNTHVHFCTNAPLWSLEHEKSRVWSCTAEPDHMGDLLKALALAYAAPVRCSAQQLAVSASRAEGNGTAFVIVAPEVSDAICQAAEILRESSGMNVAVLKASDYEKETE